MAGWHYRLKGHEFEQTPGDGEGHSSLVCCSLEIAESDPTEQLNNNSVGVPGPCVSRLVFE